MTWTPRRGQISIHAPRAGSDGFAAADGRVPNDFNPRSPCGERLIVFMLFMVDRPFQSTLPVRGATSGESGNAAASGISIHAPRAGSDNAANRMGCVDTDFNPRSPCGERPAQAGVIHRRFKDFNPRSPCGERPRPQAFRSRRRNFNPRSPCGERLAHTERDASGNEISIHAPRAGSDSLGSHVRVKVNGFQSTLPVRGATAGRNCLVLRISISIHAPRAGSDPGFALTYRICSIFQSTLPVRGATNGFPSVWRSRKISIHAPRAGSDPRARATAAVPSDFNPRSPCGERRTRRTG